MEYKLEFEKLLSHYLWIAIAVGAFGFLFTLAKMARVYRTGDAEEIGSEVFWFLVGSAGIMASGPIVNTILAPYVR